jgi:nucleotide-binding universal stress UspA family protein
MTAVGRRGSTIAPAAGAGSAARPVMLATFDVPFAPEAASFAVESAVESGQPLMVVNIAHVPILPISIAMGYEYAGTDEVEASLREPAELAHSLAVAVERLRVSSPHPVDALLELVAERSPGLLVLGPDQSRVRGRLYRKAAGRVLREAACLVWLSSD